MTVTAPTKPKEKATGSGRPAGKNWVKLIALCLVCQLVALLATEFVLYLAGLGEEEIFCFDKDLGTRHMTNKRITWRTEGFGTCYFNAEGLQDPGVTRVKPANTIRIAVLGDSMVEGLQVPFDKKFSRLLNRELNQNRSQKKIEVINFGTSGYSTAQEYVQLDKQVLSYAPDIVLLCYDSRDMFENWSPPDQTLTNIRPYALHLPGQHLVVDNSPVIQWMHSPRAKFLMSINWIRNHSRIWGLISAAETQMSFDNEIYRTLCSLLTHPGSTIRTLWQRARDPKTWQEAIANIHLGGSGPSFNIQFFEGKDPNELVTTGKSKTGETPPVEADANTAAAPQAAPGAKTAAAPEAKTGTAQAATPEPQATAPAEGGNKTYMDLMARTLDSLIEGMNEKCQAKGVRFAVAALPSRAGLCPYPGQETEVYGLKYDGEVKHVKELCANDNIPFCDMLTPALKVDSADRPGMYFALHLSPVGHRLCADQLGPFLEKLIADEKNAK